MAPASMTFKVTISRSQYYIHTATKPCKSMYLYIYLCANRSCRVNQCWVNLQFTVLEC